MSALKKYKEEANKLRAELASARGEILFLEHEQLKLLEYRDQLTAILMAQDNRAAFMDVLAHVNVRCNELHPDHIASVHRKGFEELEHELRLKYGYLFPFRTENGEPALIGSIES